MKTKKQLFEAAMKGPKLEYNVLLQLLEVMSDIRHISLSYIAKDSGLGVRATRKEMERVYREEVADGKTTKECNNKDCVYRDSEGKCKFRGKTLIENGVCKSYMKEPI